MPTCSRTAKEDGNGGPDPQTVKHVHRLLHKAFEDALKKKAASANVIHAAQPPAVERREMEAPDEDTMALLMVEAKKLGYLWLPVVIVASAPACVVAKSSVRSGRTTARRPANCA